MGNTAGKLQKLNKDTLYCICLVCILNVEYICSCCFAFAKLKLQKGNPFLVCVKHAYCPQSSPASCVIVRCWAYSYIFAQCRYYMFVHTRCRGTFPRIGAFYTIRIQKHISQWESIADISECFIFCIDTFLVLFLQHPPHSSLE